MTTPAEEVAPPRDALELDPALRPEPPRPEDVFVSPEPITVEDAWILDVYTFFHRKDYQTLQVKYPSVTGGQATAHLLIPPGDGPHATVVVFDILAGSHVVSEAMAKALVNRGFLIARIERPKMDLENTTDAAEPARALRSALLDGRRLLDILEWRADVDQNRIATAGISVGGILACLLQSNDSRVDAGIFIMPGGNVAKILSDSTERPIRAFRDNLMEREGLDVDGFVERMRPLMDPLDPVHHATRIDPKSVFLASSRFDRVIRPQHAEALWEALGRPSWTRLPIGHYQLLPMFWWTVNRGADHLDAYFAEREASASALR